MHQLSLVPIQIDILASEKNDRQLIFYNVMEKQIDPFERVVSSRIYFTNMQTHYKHLISIKKSTQNWKKCTPNKTLQLSPSKKDKLKLDRQLEIDHRNCMLFNRMAQIIKRQKPAQNNIKKSSPSRLKQTLSKIDEENLKFLDRLVHSKATISNKKLRQNRKKQLTVINGMSRFRNHSDLKLNELSSHSFRLKFNQKEKIKIKQFNQIPNHFKLRIKKVSSLPSLNEHHELNPRPTYQNNIVGNQYDSSQAYFQKQMKKIEERRQKAIKQIQNYQKSRLVKQQNANNDNFHQKEEQTITLYRKNKIINHSQYKISILRKKRSYEIKCEPMNFQNQISSIKLSEYEGNEMLQQIDYCYDALIDNLCIEDSKLKVRVQSLQHREVKQNESFQKLTDRSKLFNPSHITELANEQQSSAIYQSPSNRSETAD